MSGIFAFTLIFLIAAWCVVLGARLVFATARHALWVGSSYWGTRNRQPPTGHTALDRVDKSSHLLISHRSFWLPVIGGSDSAYSSPSVARQPRGVTTDFWYSSVRRASSATVGQAVPQRQSEQSHHRSPQQFTKYTVKAGNP
jgi:hypothetical protein